MLEQEHQYQTILIDTFKNIATHKMKLLSRLNLATIYDLLFNLPFRYEDHTYIQPLSDLLDGSVTLTTPCTVMFTVISDLPEIHTKTTVFKAQDASGAEFELTMFNCPDFMAKNLIDLPWFLAYGRVNINSYTGNICMMHPEIIPLQADTFNLPTTLSPIYHLTRGIRQDFMRRLEERALSMLAAHPLDELLPSELNPFRFTLTEALLLTHNPPPNLSHTNLVIEALPSFRRICFEELIAYKLAISLLRKKQVSKHSILIQYQRAVHQSFLASLPFTPTNAQQRVFFEIMHDCMQPQAMSRILNGDVGSGKTLVAAMCMLQCAASGLQAVMMAPTEILAQQHHQKLSQMFEPLGFQVGLLTGAVKKKERTDLLKACSSGMLKMLVGTHALFQKNVKYQCLALVIIDEQHRFGVGERESLLSKAPKGFAAHELLMTATPIPRSLRLALFNDTKVSLLNELPKGRQPVVTSLVEMSRYPYLIERLRMQCESGGQAFWICQNVEEGDNPNIVSVKYRQQELQRQMPNLKIGLLHGKMSEKEKNEVMSEFLANHYQILVATVIVEVGVDVPNASIIVIENPQNFGLSQLHQLRGRVGRGSKQSFCLLLYRHGDVYSDKNQTKNKWGKAKDKAEPIDTRRMIGMDLASDTITQNPWSISAVESEMVDNEEPYPPMRRYDVPESLEPAHEMEFAHDQISHAAMQEAPKRDMMDWQADPELTQQLQAILNADTPIGLKRLQILRCTNNGFAIASQDLILRGPGEFFGQNQSGNENFRFADLIRDYKMLDKVNLAANTIFQRDKDLAQALIERWYPSLMRQTKPNIDLTELSSQLKIKEVQSDKPESSKESESITAPKTSDAKKDSD